MPTKTDALTEHWVQLTHRRSSNHVMFCFYVRYLIDPLNPVWRDGGSALVTQTPLPSLRVREVSIRIVNGLSQASQSHQRQRQEGLEVKTKSVKCRKRTKRGQRAPTAALEFLDETCSASWNSHRQSVKAPPCLNGSRPSLQSTRQCKHKPALAWSPETWASFLGPLSHPFVCKMGDHITDFMGVFRDSDIVTS